MYTRAHPAVTGGQAGKIVDPLHELSRALEAARTPYGFTLTTWGTGAPLAWTLGQPTLIRVIDYVCGAALAFVAVTPSARFQLRRWRSRVAHVAAVGSEAGGVGR